MLHRLTTVNSLDEIILAQDSQIFEIVLFLKKYFSCHLANAEMEGCP